MSSRDLLVRLTIDAEGTTCGKCTFAVGPKHRAACAWFDKTLAWQSEGLVRLSECRSAESFASRHVDRARFIDVGGDDEVAHG